VTRPLEAVRLTILGGREVYRRAAMPPPGRAGDG
jgi:hypothetical protein